ncbi:MAG: hypothetical protein LUG50_12150 [Planctomycetaceae bacterium]|nr:hypothetical protein [Planctomycetaceae bacterium]
MLRVPTFRFSKFLVALVFTVIAGLVVVAVLRSFGLGPLRPTPEDDPAVLIRQANDGLAAIATRVPGQNRPPKYDDVLGPLDRLLALAKARIEDPEFDPVRDFESLRSLANPVIDIATRADAQARRETSYLTKEYRFNSQKAEAIQYLANAMWERIQRELPPQSDFFSETPQYPPAAMNELRRLLDDGLTADPENKQLYYIWAVVNRAEGLFAQAARDLEQAIVLDARFVAAWNTLGLVRISLKEFDAAEAALLEARAIALQEAEQLGQQPGAEYTAIVFNLATFHEALASYYNRENRITPTVEAQSLLNRHSAEARRYFEEFLTREPEGTTDYRTALGKLQTLVR